MVRYKVSTPPPCSQALFTHTDRSRGVVCVRQNNLHTCQSVYKAYTSTYCFLSKSTEKKTRVVEQGVREPASHRIETSDEYLPHDCATLFPHNHLVLQLHLHLTNYVYRVLLWVCILILYCFVLFHKTIKLYCWILMVWLSTLYCNFS